MSRGFRWYLCMLILLVAMGFGLIAPAHAQPSGIATLNEGLVGRVQRLNPLLASLNPVDADIASLIFEGLMRVNEYGEPVPALAAEMPVISFDGLEYVVRLRDDVLWQDGIPFTAADVIYTMSLLADPQFPGSESLGQFWRTVEAEQLGEFLVRFRLAQPLGSFMEALRIGILPVHALEGVPAEQIASHPFNLSPIGTGPYQLEALRSDGVKIRQVDLSTAPVYGLRAAPIPTIQHIRFHLYDTFDSAVTGLQTGEIDTFATSSANERLALLSLEGDWDYYTNTQPKLGMLLFNWARDEVGFFRDQRVRQALSIGIGRTATVERYMPNTAVRLDGPLPPGNWAAISFDFNAAYPWPDSNPAIARDLLLRARISPAEDDAEGPLLRFSLLTLDDPAQAGIARDLATQWSQFGIEVTVEVASLQDYQARLKTGNFDAVIAEISLVGSADPDVYAFWHQGQYPDGLNYGGVNDTVISEQLERARSDANGTNRQIHYAEFQRAFIDRAIAIPLYAPLFTYLVSPRIDQVQMGYLSASQDRFLTLAEWRITP